MPPTLPPRLGILTFNASVNWGSLAQAFALRTTVRGMGYDVRVIDHWWEPDNYLLLGCWARWTPKRALKHALQLALGCGFFAEALRRRRCAAFLRDDVRLTDFHLIRWGDVPEREMGLDGVIVGSDQVWNCHSDDGFLGLFLLKGAPPAWRAVAYGASLGADAMPERLKPIFREALPRFSAISVREPESVAILREVGAEAEHVLDPVLLLSAEDWERLLSLPPAAPRRRPTLLCYALTRKAAVGFRALAKAARRGKRGGCMDVELFQGLWATELPSTPGALWHHARQLFLRLFSPIRFRLSAGPKAFIAAFRDATYVVATSYHALVFATVFRKNVRILLPYCDGAVRFRWFAEHYVRGPLFAESLEEALASFRRGETVTFDEAALARDQARSKAWLRAALKPFAAGQRSL